MTDPQPNDRFALLLTREELDAVLTAVEAVRTQFADAAMSPVWQRIGERIEVAFTN